MLVASAVCNLFNSNNSNNNIRDVTDNPRETGFLASSSCQWLCNGGMRSPSATLSPPNKRRCGHFAYTTIFSAYGLCAGGLKIIDTTAGAYVIINFVHLAHTNVHCELN